MIIKRSLHTIHKTVTILKYLMNDQLTWGTTVGTRLIAWHVAQICYYGLRKFLQPAVLDMQLISSQRRVQGLLLTVLQH